MKIKNIVKNLEKRGYSVRFGKFDYWDNQIYIDFGNNNIFWICDTRAKGNMSYIVNNFVYTEVLEKLESFKAHVEKNGHNNEACMDWGSNDNAIWR